jgi:radical SAM protein with 4Fe4S-binding SPASM domain
MKPVVGSQLRLVFWEATAGCNLACRHCRRLEVSQALSKQDLTTEEGKRLIDGVAKAGRPVLVFSGGEPLLRPDLFDLAGHAQSTGLPIALATNGTLIDVEMADRIAQAGFDRVAISIDGADADTHDAFRNQPGAFERSLDGFQRLQLRQVSLQVNTTVTQHNVGQLEAMYELVDALRVDAWHLFMFVPVGCGLEVPEDQHLAAWQYEQVLGWIAEKSSANRPACPARSASLCEAERSMRGAGRPAGRAEEQAKLRGAGRPAGRAEAGAGRRFIRATCAPQYFRILAQQHLLSRYRAASHLSAMTKGCLAGTGICFVSHQGEVFPCGYLPISCGSVRAQTFPEIWERSSVLAALRDPDTLKGKCGLCEFRHICSGCRARAYAATGDYLTEEPCCAYTPSQSTKRVQ